MEYEIINSKESLIIYSSKSARYLGYPKKVPLWKINFILPVKCKIYRNDNNSDIGLEIENCIGSAYIPALSSPESLRRLKVLIPEAKTINAVIRV